MLFRSGEEEGEREGRRKKRRRAPDAAERRRREGIATDLVGEAVAKSTIVPVARSLVLDL